MSLSGRTYLFVTLIILLAIVGQWSSAEIGNLWRYPAALLLCALLLEGIRARDNKLQILHRCSERLALGEHEHVIIEVHNPTLRAIQLDTQLRLTAVLSGDDSLQHWLIPAQKTVTRKLPIVAVALDRTTPGVLYTRSLGHMGLAWWSRKVPGNTVSTVVPRALEHNESGAGQGHLGVQQAQRQQGSGDSLLTLREYQHGDSPHAIDWKATARRDKTMVRVYAHDQQMNMLLVVDAGRTSRLQAGTLTRLHHYVNIAARLAQLAAIQGDQVGLMSFSNERLDAVPLASGIRNLPIIRDQLGRLSSQPGDFNPINAALEASKMLRQRCLVVFLCEIEQREAATQLAKACSLLSPKHLALVASLVDSDVQELQENTATGWLDPYRRLAALEYTDSQRATALKLKRLGAEVVLSEPCDLDRKIMQRYRSLRQRQRV
jgi:uncharacterized protein (DUF58 family)